MMMKKFGTVAAATAAAAALSLGTAAPAMAWLHPGESTQHPSDGGTWRYGFWNAHVRSYYLHPSRCHGSTVEYNGSRVRSIDTAGGSTSIAEKFALNTPGASDRYWYRTC
ncbi:lactococcin 972 family bacteriocin [Amycolatopsis sp. NPDC089917]|uniref:lactococcin 972 family bacteriocin n=1 Tax=Amycolatopsis sp. NPDC089917 TaxID=3155187 RepID=UPI003430A0CD